MMSPPFIGCFGPILLILADFGLHEERDVFPLHIMQYQVLMTSLVATQRSTLHFR